MFERTAENNETVTDERQIKPDGEVTGKIDVFSGGTTGVQTMRRTGAHGSRGAHPSPKTINRLHGSAQDNKQLLSANCLFLLINGPISNNILLKIMDTLQKKVICGL